MASSQLAVRAIPAVAGLRASSSSSNPGGRSSSVSYTSTSTSSSGLRRASSSATASSSSSSKQPGPPTSSSSASQFDLQACIDILKKLQPQVSPDLPALFVTPPVENQKGNSNNKRKLQEGSAVSSSVHSESDPKRQRRETSPRRERDSRLASSSTSDASSSTSSEHRGSHLKRSDSSSSSATSISSSQAATASNKALNNNTTVADDHISPLSNLPSPAAPETTAAAATPIQPTQWTKERLRKIAAACRDKGRELKHSGDRKMREYRPDSTNQHIPVLALLEQVDAIVLYACAFWCEDLAIGTIRSRQASNTSTDSVSSSTSSSTAISSGGPGSPGWKMGCNQENWKSLFGLLAFVKGKAEKLAASPIPSSASETLAREVPRIMELIVAWLAMLEALILQHLTTNLSRNLHSQASRLLAASASALSPPGGDADSAGRHTPLSTSGSSSTSDKTSSPPSDAFLQNFMKLQNDLEKIHAQWPASQAVLLSSSADDLMSTGRISPKRSIDEDILARVLRKGKMAYDIEPTKLDDIVIPTIPKLPENGQPVGPEDLFKDEENYYHFSWPIVLHHQNSVAHATCFGRALLSEISERLNLDYQAVQLE